MSITKLILWVVLLSGVAFAQYTNVSAQVLDPGGNIYANCTVSASFVNNTGLSQLPLISGSTFQTQVNGISCDSNGNFTLRLADSNAITPLGTQWKFSICAKNGSTPCFSYTAPACPAAGCITGASITITTALQAASAPLGSPISPGNVGGSLLPSVDNTYNLGGPNRWLNGYFSNLPANMTLGGNNIFTGSNTFQTHWLFSVSTTAAALQTDINTSCNGTIPGRVMLPQGTIVIGTTLTLPSTCDIGGHGKGKTILQIQTGATLTNGLFVNSNTVGGNVRISLHDLTIDSNSQNYSAVFFNNVSQSDIYNNEFLNSGATLQVGGISCIVWSSGQGSSTANTVNTHNSIHDNYFSNCGGDAIGYGGVKSEIHHNIVENIGDTGCGFQGFGTADDSCSNNTFINTTCGVCGGPNPGSVAGNGHNDRIVVSDNTIRNDTKAGYGILSVQGNGWTISKNTINIPPNGPNNSPAIQLDANIGTAVTGNTIGQSAGQGIYEECSNSTANSKDDIISGNAILNAGLAGIRVEAAVSGCIDQNVTVTGNTVDASSQRVALANSNIELAQASGATLQVVPLTGNTAVDTQVSKTAQYGLQILGSPSFVGLSNNSFGGGTGAANSLGQLVSPIWGVNNWIGSIPQDTPTFSNWTILGTSSGTRLNAFPDLSAGAFNNQVQSHDSLLTFDINGGLATGGLVIAPHANATSGIRIDGATGKLATPAGQTIGGGSTLARYARYALTLSPSLVAANTTAEQSFATSVTSGDVIVGVSKPTAQAGLGIVGWRASGTTLFITFSNNTASPITPTASEVYAVVAVQ